MPLDMHIQMLIYNTFVLLEDFVFCSEEKLLMNKVVNYVSECLKFECLKSIGGLKVKVQVKRINLLNKNDRYI